jgi:hypothetical protein
MEVTAKHFEYNKHIVQYIRRNPGDPNALHKVHLLSLKWLYDNLQNGRDFLFTGENPATYSPIRQNSKSVLMVQELIWFADEKDLLAFRMATGL